MPKWLATEACCGHDNKAFTIATKIGDWSNKMAVGGSLQFLIYEKIKK